MNKTKQNKNVGNESENMIREQKLNFRCYYFFFWCKASAASMHKTGEQK